MKKNSNYFSQRDYETTMRLNKIVSEDLPDFCREFFTGIESVSTALTRLNYAYDLRVFFGYLTLECAKFRGKQVKNMQISHLNSLTADDVELFLSYLTYYVDEIKKNSKKSASKDVEVVEKIKKNSLRGKARKLSTVKTFLKFFFKKQKIDKNVAELVSTPKLREKEIVRLDGSEISQLLDVVEEGKLMTDRQNIFQEKTRTRDFAMISLFLGTGIRVSECVGLNLDDVNLRNNSFVITRKGGSRTVLYFSEEVALPLSAYMEDRIMRKDIDSSERALFLSLQKRRITTRAVQNLVKKYNLATANLKKITPHKLRSSFGTELYRSTGDIYVVADVLGHKDVNTTKKHYAAISDDIRRNASKMVSLRKK